MLDREPERGSADPVEDEVEVALEPLDDILSAKTAEEWLRCGPHANQRGD